MIIINGKQYTGNNISVNNEVKIDGVFIDELRYTKVINISGNCETIISSGSASKKLF